MEASIDDGWRAVEVLHRSASDRPPRRSALTELLDEDAVLLVLPRTATELLHLVWAATRSCWPGVFVLWACVGAHFVSNEMVEKASDGTLTSAATSVSCGRDDGRVAGLGDTKLPRRRGGARSEHRRAE